jgi:hypothetical protein
MYKGMKAPAKNKNGLIIPPTPIELSPKTVEKKGIKSMPDRHHVYFPRYSFLEAGEVAQRFREHRFNSVWLPRFQHERLHRRYDNLVKIHPNYFIPEEEVMLTFLDEAKILENLDVNLRAVDMIDDAIYEGRVADLGESSERREERIENIANGIKLTNRIEIVPRHIRYPYIVLGRSCLGIAA